MVRYKNATVTILTESTTVNDEGDVITSYAEVETIKGDVQPHVLTKDEVALYGIDTKSAVRRFFYDGVHPNVKSGNRAQVASDLTQATDVFSIMPVSAWPRHGECLLVPVENEDIEAAENGD